MDIVKLITDDIYDDFEAWLDEATFTYLTEHTAGPSNYSLISRAEYAICAMRGVDYDDYVNESIDEHVTYNEIFGAAQELSHEVIEQLISRYVVK